jgi:hypothetical protein
MRPAVAGGELKMKKWGFRIFVFISVLSILLNILFFWGTTLTRGTMDRLQHDLSDMREFSIMILHQSRFLVRLIDSKKCHIHWKDAHAAADGIVVPEPTFKENASRYYFVEIENTKDGFMKNIDIMEYPEWVKKLYKDSSRCRGCLEGKYQEPWLSDEVFIGLMKDAAEISNNDKLRNAIKAFENKKTNKGSVGPDSANP